jgi:F0F1-type ATP synthase assembly protein I
MALKAMAAKPDKSVFWLGKYLSLGLTLPASVAAGYMLGTFADHHFHMPLLRVVGILLGFAAGLIQILKELSRDEKRS